MSASRGAVRRPITLFLQFLLAVTSALAGFAGGSLSSATNAFALGPPSAVSEYQPSVNATNTSGSTKWGGRSIAVDVDPTTSSVAIAGTESGGLFRTADGGANWSHLDGLAPFQISDVKFVSNNRSAVIVSTWQTSDSLKPGGLWRSADGGTSWARPALPGGCNGNFFAWGMATEAGTGNVYAGADCGLLFSTDQGATWGLISQARVESVVAQNSTVDVCAGDGHRRYTRTGTTLTQVGGTHQINGGGCPFPRNYQATNHNIAAEPQESNVLFTMNGGPTSTTLCGGTSANPAGLWYLYESDDSGVNWNRIGGACPSREPWVATVPSRDGIATHFDVYYSGGLDTTRITCTSGGSGNRCTGLFAAANVTSQHSDHNAIAFRTGSNCPEFLASDGGAQLSTAPDCGANFQMAAGSGSANGNYNALQVYEVNGQVHPGHTDLYFGTQDNDNWASPDNGATWPRAACCEGFFFQTPRTAPNDTAQTVSFVTCAGCKNLKSPAHFTACGYNPACSGWPNPAGSSPGPDSGAPFNVQKDKAYLQWSQNPAPTNQLNLTTDAGGSWKPITGATLGQTMMSHMFVAGSATNPVVYQPYCTVSCGFIAPAGGIKKITGINTTSATPSGTVGAADAGLGQLGTYNDGVGSWLIQEAALGVEPTIGQHLVAADVQTGKMKQSNDGGSSWTIDNDLTNRVTGFGRYGFTIPIFGTQAHAIAFDPNNSNRILVGTHEAGIIASIDGGATWTTMLGSTQIPNVTGFFFDNVQNDIIVSSFGRGLWKLDMTRRAATLAYTGDVSGDYNDTVTLSATLYDSLAGPTQPIANAKVTLSLGTHTCTLTTDAAGHVACSFLDLDNPGAQTVTGSFAGDAQYSPAASTTPFTLNREETRLTYTGATTQDYHDPATMSAVLVDPAHDPVQPIAGKTVTFVLGAGDTCSAVTDPSGVASCLITPTQPAGTVILNVSFAGDSNYLPTTTTASFVITREETTTTYTGDTIIANGFSAHLSGVLKEDGVTPIAGRSITFTLGSGASAQTCLGTTNASGFAECTINPVNQPLGPGTVRAAFLGDAFYLPSSDTRATVLFGFLARGAMVIGDMDAMLGRTVTFWGSQWAGANHLSGGPAPNAFKGFASGTTHPPVCGTDWTWRPGNSGAPPATVPEYMGTIVSTTITKHGNTTAGDTFEIVVVHTNPGYEGNPGHPGTGTLVASPSDSTQPAVFCHS